MKNNLKNYAWYIGVFTSILAVVVAVGSVFNFKVNEVAITSVATALLGVLVAAGVIEKDDYANEIMPEEEFEDEEIEDDAVVLDIDEKDDN